jgi:hypothetical protein
VIPRYHGVSRGDTALVKEQIRGPLEALFALAFQDDRRTPGSRGADRLEIGGIGLCGEVEDTEKEGGARRSVERREHEA